MPENPSSQTTIFCHYILDSLDRLLACLDGLSEEQLNWRPSAPNANSLYVLAAHTLSNLEENICYTLFNQPAPRHRDLAFQRQDYTLAELHAEWQSLRERVQNILLHFSQENLEQEYIHPRRGRITGLDILIVVARHAAEHLGQAELTRDLLLASFE